MRWLMMGYEQESERLQALEQAGHTVDVVENGDTEAWQAASRTLYDGIWVRWAEADHGIRGVVGYRAQRPTTRIVVEIPDDVSPPNPEIGAWVNLGIYDIIRPNADTLSVVGNPRTIADALSWSGLKLPTADDSPEKKKPEIRTVEVTKKVAVSTRPVLIVVVGTSPGAGNTTTAVEIASYLAKSHDVALAETLKAPPALARWADELPKGIVTFPHPAPDPMDLLRRREWPYVVVDAGAIEAWHEISSWDADLTILVGPGDEHRFGRWEALVSSVARQYPQRIVAGAIVGGPDSKRIIEGLDDEAGLSGFSLDGPQKRVDRALAEMLAPVLPDGKTRRRWWRDTLHTPEPPAPPRELGMRQEGSAVVDSFLRPREVDVRVRGDEPSPLGKAFRWAMDALILWGFISLAAWVVVLANNAGAAGPVGQVWVARAYGITQFNSTILRLLHL